ncbi:MAG: thioredoxin [Cytophagaceae bacterium]|jgi:thioredoxin 1|nr:thioredoxin [Cytophagaceae bacterium]
MKKSFQELIQSETPLLVDFYATWCGPCKAMAPALEEIASRWNEKIKVIKIDIDKNPEAAQQWKIQAVPTLMLFRQGNVLARQAGAMSLGEMEKLLSQHV